MGMYDEPARIERLEFSKDRRIIVTSDVHANIPYFKGLLNKLSFSDDDELIIAGDFLEKGSDSLGILRLIMQMSEKGNVHCIMGNCDDWSAMFKEKSKWSSGILSYVNYRRSGLIWDMIHELGDEPSDIIDFSTYIHKIGEGFPKEFAFLEKLPQAIETKKYVFAHAAVYDNKPLSEHTVAQLLRCDRYLDLGCSFDRWIVVGHYPVVLYGDDKVCANPIVLRDRHIICIDGACTLKDDGQLNALIIPNIDSEDFYFDSYDGFPTRKVLDDQAEGEHSYYIRWGDSKVQVLERGEEFSRCRHLRTGYEMDILTKYLFTSEPISDCNDCTDYIIPLKKGDVVSVVEETSRGYFVKHKGVSGWYFGKLQ